MALLKFISLSVGSLMLLQGAYATDPSATAQSTDCLQVMNTARTAVGLTAFQGTEGGDSAAKALATNVETMKTVCSQLSTSTTAALKKLTTTAEGTAIYFVQDNANCTAAVDQWKKGFSSLGTTTSAPPAFKTGEPATDQTGDAPYNTTDAVNFVALYSPTGTKAECAFVDCTTASPAGPKALVCVVHPAALVNGNKPFDDTQWKSILKVFAPQSSASSASAAVPTLLALAAAAVGVALM